MVAPSDIFGFNLDASVIDQEPKELSHEKSSAMPQVWMSTPRMRWLNCFSCKNKIDKPLYGKSPTWSLCATCFQHMLDAQASLQLPPPRIALKEGFSCALCRVTKTTQWRQIEDETGLQQRVCNACGLKKSRIAEKKRQKLESDKNSTASQPTQIYPWITGNKKAKKTKNIP